MESGGSVARTQVRQAKEIGDLMVTRLGNPDMRIKSSRHNPALVIAQQLNEQTSRLFRELGQQDIESRGEEESLEEEYPNGLEGQTTGRPDMRLRPIRHDPKLVAMQEVTDRIQTLKTQIAINQGLIEGNKNFLPSLEDLFDSDFLNTEELAAIMAERVPEYETLRKRHERYGKIKMTETTSHTPEEPPPPPPPAQGGRRRIPSKEEEPEEQEAPSPPKRSSGSRRAA